MKKIVSKLALLAIVSAVLNLAFLPTVFAIDTTYHMYTDEIQTDQRVYHITACNKIESWGVVQCTKESKQAGTYGKQCDEDKEIGRTIMGCLIEQDTENVVNYGESDSKKIEGSSYPFVITDKYLLKKEEKGCSNAAKAQSPLYGKLYAVGSSTSVMLTPESDPLLVDHTVAVAESIGTPEDNWTPVYQSGVCVVWDKLAESSRDPTASATDAEIKKKATDMLETMKLSRVMTAFEGIANTLSGTDPTLGGCNNSNTDPQYKENRSTKLNAIPSVSCSLRYRVSGTSGSDVLSKIIASVYKWAASVVGIVSVLVIVISGVEISMAGSGGEGLDKAKNRIMQSIIGLAILFLSGLILYLINPTFFV